MVTALAPQESPVTVLARTRAATAYTLAEMRERVEQLDAVYRGLMQKGTDYDEVGGTHKPTLLQPGAQLLCTFFGFAPSMETLPTSIEDWERGLFALTVRCRLTRGDGTPVAEGIGSCNGKEDKYRWRLAKRVCPACGAQAIIKGKAEYGGGWLCFKKQDGCGAKFRDGDPVIEDQPAGRVENEDPYTLHNTILKMAQKRALVAATLNGTGASRIFTQDVEDLPEFSRAPQIVEVSADGSEASPFGADTPGAAVPSESRGAPVNGAGPATSSAPATSGTAAAPELRARFDAKWRSLTERAIACGVAPERAPAADAPTSALRAATNDLEQQIAAREALNARLLERITLVNERGADFAVPTPSQLTDLEVHDQIRTCDEILAELGLGVTDDDDAF